MNDETAITDQMQRLIQDWQRSGDRREIFLSCYAMMTSNMLDAIHAGGFEDNMWVDGLLRCFAGYYFHALDTYEAGPAAAPAVWRVAFDATRDPATHALQHLGLGVNAHINYDLVFALVDQLAPEWAGLDPAKRESRHRDHEHVNDIIYQTVDAVQDQVVERYNPGLDIADKLLGPLDEWLTAWLIAAWREQVWGDALRLLACPDGSARQPLLHDIERRSLGRAHVILGGKQ